MVVLHQSLRLMVAVCVMSSQAQLLPFWRRAPEIPAITANSGLPGKDSIKDGADSLGQDVLSGLKRLSGVPGLKGGIGDTGLTGLASMTLKLQLQQLKLKDQISRLEKVLLLKGMIQEVGGKILTSNGKEVDFTTSKATCEAVGGRIATPMNEKENNAIATLLKEYNRYAYLGIKEGLLPGKFSYLNGIPVTYTRWLKSEPNGQGKETCVEMYTDGQWNDKVCNQNRLTVCEL